jgi:hypothetical protein
MTDLAERLDIDLGRTPICRACLSFVSMSLARDDGGRKARGWARRMARDLWEEGLESPLRESLGRAQRQGDAEAGAALREVDAHGWRAAIVPAVIVRLAIEQNEEAHAALQRLEDPMPVFGFTRWRGSDVYTKESDV